MNSETSNASHWLHVAQKLPILSCQSLVLICVFVRFFSLQNVILVLQSTFTSANSGCFCCHALVGVERSPSLQGIVTTAQIASILNLFSINYYYPLGVSWIACSSPCCFLSRHPRGWNLPSGRELADAILLVVEVRRSHPQAPLDQAACNRTQPPNVLCLDPGFYL